MQTNKKLTYSKKTSLESVCNININCMTKKDFEKLPLKSWGECIEFSSMVILPGNAKNKHESGYRKMDFIACDGEKAICRLSGCSDVIHMDGLGGFGKDWLSKFGKCPSLVPVSAWSIDCLPESGLLRIWPNAGKMTCGSALSSFEIYMLSNK